MIHSTKPPWPSRPALFLDLDGTLLEIAARPDEAAPTDRLHALLPRLAPATGGAVALISGRGIAELDRLLAPHRFAAAGVHGLERRGTDGAWRGPPPDSAPIAVLRERLAEFAARHEGLLFEDKGFGAALHYRARPELATEVHSFAAALLAESASGLELLRGKMVVEIKPGGMDKGRAILSFMEEPPFAGRQPVFIGDDVTDEAGFAVVNELEGISVKVDAGATFAHWQLDGVAAVLTWLEDAIAGAEAHAEHNWRSA